MSNEANHTTTEVATQHCPKCKQLAYPDIALSHGWFYCDGCDSSFKLKIATTEAAQAADQTDQDSGNEAKSSKPTDHQAQERQSAGLLPKQVTVVACPHQTMALWPLSCRVDHLDGEIEVAVFSRAPSSSAQAAAREIWNKISAMFDSLAIPIDATDQIAAIISKHQATETAEVRKAAEYALECLQPIARLGRLPQGGESSGN